MEIYAQSSKFITKLITEFQNNKIDKQTLNKNILINTIFCSYHLQKQNKKYKKIKEEQNKTYQSFFKLEQAQEESEKQLISKIRDRKSKRIVEESIRQNRENLLNDLASKKYTKIFQEQNYNSYIPPKNFSLSINFELNKKIQNSKKLISETNAEISYINPSLNQKDEKLIINDFIEPPYIDDLSFDNIDISEEMTINKEKENCNYNTKNNETTNDNTINIDNNNENDIFSKMLDEDDEILFYDERLRKNEKMAMVNTWMTREKKDDIIRDFEEFKQRKKRNEYFKVDSIFNILKQDNVIKKEISTYLKNTAILYDEISKQDHLHEFTGYLSEKVYKMYMKKMNYSYLILMLLSFFDYEKFSNNFEYMEDSQIIVVFIKKILLFCGIATNKVYESIIHNAENKKGNLTFENYLSCFLPIFELSEKYQCYKYRFLLYLVKKTGYNTISVNNYRLFCNLIRGKLIYEADTCGDIIGKMIPILKAKYPKDDLDDLNYQHVSIVLEFLVNYEYGD